MVYNPYAIYVRCDGAMDYDSQNSGGIGYIIEFPDSLGLDPIKISKGIYTGGNIERLELEALIEAMQDTIDIVQMHGKKLRGRPVRIITDRIALQDTNRTNPYTIRKWRKNGWKNHEGKEIKNREQLDKLDKTRKKLSEIVGGKVEIEWKRRKHNKGPDKLAKAGKKWGLKTDKLAKKGEKIGKRKFNGTEIVYKALNAEDRLIVNVFRKDPLRDQWEVWVEICQGTKKGQKLKIYVDDRLEPKLMRGNQFEIRIKKVLTHHIEIYRTIKKSKLKTDST